MNEFKKQWTEINKTEQFKKDQVDSIMRWENGEMTVAEEIKFFQGLVDSGLAWSLPDIYGRTALGLIDVGKIKDKRKQK